MNKVKIIMSYEGNEIEREFDFSKIENIDFNEKVDDMYETLLNTEPEPMTNDDYQDNNPREFLNK